jgi:hypothetical protein
MIRIFKFISVAIIIFACDGNPEMPSVVVADFFPLQKGLYFIYDVDETQISLNVESHSIYELKMSVTDSFKHEVGGYTYVVSRFKRLSTSLAWAPLQTWTARQDGDKLVVTEGNTSFVSLAAPLFRNSEWNGNALNTLGGEESCGQDYVACDVYKLENLNEQISIGDQSFENVLTVVENDEPNLLVTYDVRKTKYGRDIGLIYTEKEILNYCTVPISCYGTRFVNSGYRYKQTLKEYGKE